MRGSDWPLPVISALRISDFADLALILPLAFCIGLLLALSGWRRGALAWAAAIGSTLALMLLLKLRFFGCSDLVDAGNPSGHTAAAAAVYGGLAALIAGAIRDDMRWATGCGIAVATVLAIIVGQSRLTLDKHSVGEVLAGGTIGIGGAASFVMLAGPPTQAIRIGRIVVAGLVIIVLLYGARLSAESTIKSMASYLWLPPGCEVLSR